MNATMPLPTPPKKPRKAPIDRLSEKRDALEKELADTRSALRQKLAAKAAREAAIAKKQRTQSLILLGLLFARLLRDMNASNQEYFMKKTTSQHQADLKTLEAMTDPKKTPDQLDAYKKKRRATLDREHDMLTAIMQSAIAGTFK